MDAEDALIGYPFFALGDDEFSYSVVSDKLQVFDLAHPVFCPVAFVEMPEPGAWKFRAIKAETTLAFGANSEAAFYAGHWFVLLNVFTTRAGILFA